MEAVSLTTSRVPLGAQTRSVSALTSCHSNLFTSSRCLLGDVSSRRKKHHLLFSALPVDYRNLTAETAAAAALKVLEEDVQKESKVRWPPSNERLSPGGLKGALRSLGKTVANALFEFLQYTPLEEENGFFLANFAPVDEIGEKVRVEVISGAIPESFPLGTYIRTGPNPLFSGKFYKSKLGITEYHWFEGDGMLHAVYFEKCGDEYELFYKNKYVETKGYLIDKEEGRPVVLAVAVGTPIQLLLNILLNQGRVFAAAENNLPYEINVSDLSTVGEFDCNGVWPFDTFTSHPKIDPVTNELIFQGFSVMKKPYAKVGVIGADGETLVHTVDMDTEMPGINHEIMITERYTVVMDFSCVIDRTQIAKGKPAIYFDYKKSPRFGVLPRFGDSNSIRWFQVEKNCLFHCFNAYEDGNEVVVHGLRAKSSILNFEMNFDRADWYKRGISTDLSDPEVNDPLIDSALAMYLHEWRLDLEAGTVTERDIYDEENYAILEFPRINESYVGRKYRYGYTLTINLDESLKTALPYFGGITKVDFSSAENGKGVVKTEFHDLGPNRYGSEPMFVAKPGSTVEDEGWIVMLVHEENTNVAEAIIIDAQKFTEKPVARILLPHRIPFGFHGTFVHAG